VALQVVLPDKDRNDRDDIIFLHESHLAADDSTAQQRCAVAALARVARDLPLERVLPLEFRPLFATISEEVRSCYSSHSQCTALLDGAACAGWCVTDLINVCATSFASTYQQPLVKP
jgi:hypothetical protein